MGEWVAGLPPPNCYSGNEIKRVCAAGERKSGQERPHPTTMKVTDKDVAHVADLANLELTEHERGLLLRDLNSILDYIDRLNQLDTTDVPPMAQVSDRYEVEQSKSGSARFASASREDILEGLRKSLPPDLALQNAPDSDGTFFKVPKVIER
jgi:aspartyl-tRNA(Asn)/glutamyl-tRNA(Gln) amidotransferase subunit C